MTTTVPEFHGVTVKRITQELEGLALWVQPAPTGNVRRPLPDDAVMMLHGLTEGLARNELTDALTLCGVTAFQPDRRQ